ncbi:hydrolase [Aureococcus anophagefferens]|nr:hydrolase [Aureococcus anophagefferens]
MALRFVLVAVAAATPPSRVDDAFQWNATPKCAPCRVVPDGPIVGNGDLGVVIGGSPGTALGPPGGAPGGDEALGLYFGKNDYWGWPDALTFHASFMHFSPGFTISNATLAARVSNADVSIEMSNARVLLENVLVADVVATCAGAAAELNLTIGSDNLFAMPLVLNASTPALEKASVKDDGWRAPLMVPCTTSQIVFNSERAFAVDASGFLRGAAGQCVALRHGSPVAAPCDNTTRWRLRADGRVESPEGTSCLAAKDTGVDAACPPHSYYTDANATGACQSSKYVVAVGACDAATRWSLNDDGFLEDADSGRCLALAPRLESNGVAVAARLLREGVALDARKSAPAPDGRSRSFLYDVSCGERLALRVAVLSERDAEDPLAAAVAAAAVETENASATAAFWEDYWTQVTSLSLDAHPDLERYFYASLYLQRGAMRVGKTPPALWGPYSTTDFPGWSDDVTLDYNFEANYWATTMLNAPELAAQYNDFILKESRLVELARRRAALEDWSLGGWPDVAGAEVSGMSSRASDFGGFGGFAFVSCTGAFRGMECCFDDGTRFVAGLVATPMLSYYDGTRDEAFLEEQLVPYLRGVAEFYESYAVDGHLPFTCAQETCNSDPKVAQHNNHQDLAYARMVYQRLIDFGDDVERWSRSLAALAPFPLANASRGRVFAEAVNAGPAQPAPDSNAAYAITHLAAIWPGRLVDAAGADRELLSVARNTVALVNDVTDFAPGNGFVLNWPASALVVDGRDAGALWANLSAAYARRATPNGWPDLGGGGLEQNGALAAVGFALARVVDGGVLRLFAGWPDDAPAAFERLRVDRALLLSARGGARAARAPRRGAEGGGAADSLGSVADAFCDGGGLALEDLSRRHLIRLARCARPRPKGRFGLRFTRNRKIRAVLAAAAAAAKAEDDALDADLSTPDGDVCLSNRELLEVCGARGIRVDGTHGARLARLKFWLQARRLLLRSSPEQPPPSLLLHLPALLSTLLEQTHAEDLAKELR